MTQSIIDRLVNIKEELIKWPDGHYKNGQGHPIDPDAGFKIIEADLRQILDKILALPEDERKSLKEVIEDFKNTMAERQHAAEENFKVAREKIIVNQGVAKATKAYGKAIKRQTLSGDSSDESTS